MTGSVHRTTSSATSTGGGSRRSRSRPTCRPPGDSWTCVLEAEAQVGDILREASEESAAGGAELGSNRQKIGDLFASFVDEEQVEALGSTPLTEDLAAISDVADIASTVRAARTARARGHVAGWSAATSTPMTAAPTATSSTSPRAGSACPTSRTTARTRSPRPRDKYVAHVAAMLRLVGWSDADAIDGAQRVMALETRLAAGHWDNVASRDVIATYNLTTFDELRAAAPAFDWAAWVVGDSAAPTAPSPRSSCASRATCRCCRRRWPRCRSTTGRSG